MPDLIDEILDKLSPASLELLDQIDLEPTRESKKFSEELRKSLIELDEIELKRSIREIDNKAELLVRKTGKCKSFLDKYEVEYEKIHCMEIHGDDNKKIQMYLQQIESLQKQLNELMRTTSAEELFTEIIEMDRRIEELEVQKKELTDAIKGYEGFPSSIKEAQYCISDLKERIKKKEAMLDS